MNRFTLCALVLLSTGCLDPVQEGDAGSGGGSTATGGGTASTGGGSGGGSTATGGGSTATGGGTTLRQDGGTLFDITEALIAPVGAPPSLCNSHGVLYEYLTARVPTDAGCGNGCLWEVTETAARKLFTSAPGGLPVGELIWFDVSTGPDWHVFTTYQSQTPLSHRLVAVSTNGGGAVQLLETLPDAMNIDVRGTWFQGTFHYVINTSPQMAGAPGTTQLKVWNPASASGSVSLATLPGHATSPLFIASFAGKYALQLADGIYTVGMNGTNVTRVFASTALTAFTAGDTGSAFFAEKLAGVTTLYRLQLFNQTTLTVLGTGLEVEAVAQSGADGLAVLNSTGVYVVDASSRAARLVYRGGGFIQGFFRLKNLLAESGRLYVGEICYPDADAPEWGTVELVPPSVPGATPASAGRATWLTGTADWPWRTPVLDSSAASWSPELPAPHTARNGFVLHTVGD